ncbi:hypothetical protein ACIPW9_36485 [Streptomyces sp. NPDC090052]|uniref:hypothetical protein n=1 Tax=Streptomyces sp. NPDC090052 TaxID=3365931 RepID=UPI00380FDAC7
MPATPDRRPHQHDSTEVLKAALARTSEDAKRYAQTGPKKWEDATHEIADEFLDELRIRGEL